MPTSQPSPQPVTRFAPSPTGYLHIGGARTALFNWLYARGRGGKFLLRIEDTDRARHSEEAVEAILDGLSWLGLDWDGEPISQFARRDRHMDVALQLLADGKAYKCYLAGAELESARNEAKAAGHRFESPWRDADPASTPEDKPFVIRFRAPTEGRTTINDEVQGEVSFPNSALDDLVILRSAGDGAPGAPTYNLAVVVDDHDMGVTHIIRGDDHLNNAARQQQIYDALNWPAPKFAHVPLIHGSDGAKLSKRHGALGVEAYRDLGFLPKGLTNYLLRLGWSHGDDEIISKQEAIEWFGTDNINKAPSRLDLEKLKSINSHYMTALSDEAFVSLASPFLSAAGLVLDPENAGRLTRAASALKTRCATLADSVEKSEFLFLARPLTIEGKAAKPLKKEDAHKILSEVADRLHDEPEWRSAEYLDEILQDFAARKGIGFSAVGAPLRASLTAGRPSPGIGEVLYSLGREETLARIRDQL
ncbi:MAG: glutamate--tRNA ligase [Pseudomonadota bacterium]